MSLRSNADLTFQSYEVTDSGIILTFLCSNPGPGEVSLWSINLTDAEIASITTLTEFRNLVTAKLQRKFRASGIATRLNAVLGTTVTV